MSKQSNSQEPQRVDPKIRDVEREIVEFFAEKSSEFTGRNPIVSKVMTYFSIRKRLTQKELRELTGFSAGTISKAVRQLLGMNVISKETVPGTHTHIYIMDKLPFVSPHYFLRTETVMEKKILELEQMKKTLDANEKQWENFESYKKIYATVMQLLQILPTIHVFLDRLEEELKKQQTAV